jgi:hypothetical protein
MVTENGLDDVILQFLPATETGKPEDKNGKGSYMGKGFNTDSTKYHFTK